MEHVQTGITGAWHQLGGILGKSTYYQSLSHLLGTQGYWCPRDLSTVSFCCAQGKKVFETRSHHVGQAGLELVVSFLLCLLGLLVGVILSWLKHVVCFDWC